jgi:predicted metal-binding membrane protein
MAPASVLAGASGVVALIAGGFQLSNWKIRRLACCRDVPASASLPADAGAAWFYGLRLGAHCTACCLGFMLLLLVTGMMSLVTLIIVAVAITLERLGPRPALIARASGVGLLAAGLFIIARAAGAL